MKNHHVGAPSAAVASRAVRRSLMSSAVMAALAAMSAQAQDVAQAPASAASAPARGDVERLDAVIVTGTARREGQLKKEAGFSITTANEEQIKQAAPSSTADLLKIVPGVFVETTGGNAGANVRVRGFPMDGDAPFTTMQYNGSPLYPEAKLSFFENSALFRLDDTIDRVEVLRGGPSTIFGSGQVGVTVNFIQKKGTALPEGGLRLTTGSGNLRRFDSFYTDKLSEHWYVSLGGFYRTASGVRDTQFPADEGGQFSGMLTRKLDDGELSIYGRRQDEKNAFFTPIPLTASADGKSYSAFPGFDPLTASFYGNELRHIRLEVNAPSAPGGLPGTIERDLAQGRGASANNIGLNFDKKFGEIAFSSKSSYMSAHTPTYGLFTGPNPTTLGDYIAGQIAAANADTAALAAAGAAATAGQARFVNGGASITDMDTRVIQAGMWVVDKDLQSFSTENRLSFDLGERNTLTAGVYLADYSSKDLWYLNRSMLMTVEPHARPIDIELDNGVRASRNGFVTPPWTYDVNASYNGRATAFYLSDEWRATDKLRLDGGIRHEKRRLDGTLENLTYGDLDADPLTIFNNNVARFNGSHSTFSESFAKTSWTLGANYNVNSALSTFVRLNQGYRFPDFDDIRDGKRGVEDVKQAEIGVNTVTPLYTAFLTAFANRLSNSQFQRFTGAGNLVQEGGSKTVGLEFELALRPLRGLELALSGNVQDAKLDGGPNSGKRVQRQPKLQFRFTPSYKIPTELGQLRVFGTWTHVGDRFGDAENQQFLPKYDTLDAGVVAHLNNGLDVRLTGTNLTNELGITEGNIRAGVGSTGISGGSFLGRPVFGRALELSVGFNF
ncbi:Colicin I receptor [Burkholderiaceae bacterium]|nr:Colicin I receptor [Burkholderiaceae bacterium]